MQGYTVFFTSSINEKNVHLIRILQRLLSSVVFRETTAMACRKSRWFNKVDSLTVTPEKTRLLIKGVIADRVY